MGQRHQIYVKMPDKLGIAGFHHQWLYGMTAVKTLARVLKFHGNQDDYGPLKKDTCYGLERQAEAVRALLSIDVDTGYWHYVHNLNADAANDSENTKSEAPAEVQDPRNGDNNDGITIIDVSNGEFRYCFMNIDHLEGEVNPKKFTPLTAREYLLCYYPKLDKGEGRNGNKLGAEEKAEALAALELIESKAKVLTLAECKKLFPKMYKKAKE